MPSGKFVNGFIADYRNIKRFMATGLILSAAVNALMGLLGLAHSVVPTAVIFVTFAVMWGSTVGTIHGERPRPSYPSRDGIPPGTGNLLRILLSASHNLGEFFSFLFVGSIVTFAGWQAGFFGSAVAEQSVW